jgi:hypothetical protein
MKAIFQPNHRSTDIRHPLNPFLALYVAIMNANDGPAFETLFTPDAVVKDEGHEYRGATEIGDWLTEVHRKYRPYFEATEISKDGSETVISGTVSGTFDGSPIDIFHHLTIVNRQIAALTIRG